MAALAVAARAESDVTIYMNIEPNTGGGAEHAREAAAEAFAAAGVRTEWRAGRPTRDQLRDKTAIVINLVDHGDPGFRPDALAWTDLCEGVHITVYWDRIVGRKRPAPASVVLAHVLVHEVTHVLQGISRHAETGVMKARWTNEDYQAMRSKMLPFTRHDLELIQLGLARRSSVIPQT
jgi:hypothetical protein